MKTIPQGYKALAGIFLLLIGGALVYFSGRRYSEKRYIVDAASCRMQVLAIERKDLPPAAELGSVVLFHGISANNIIMQYIGRAFAEQGLRVYIPDLPGHGRSAGPFSPAQAEACSASLVRGLAARGMIIPDRTILAGHSMGAAIALRVAEKFRPAGLVAISPAPMKPDHGVIPQNLLFNGVPKILPNTRVIVGRFEHPGLKDNAADLVPPNDPAIQYAIVPWATHVTILFSPTAVRLAQAWAANILGLTGEPRLPNRLNLLACFLGLAGILLLAGPLVRELVGGKPPADFSSVPTIPRWRGALAVALLALLMLYVWPYFKPLQAVRLFEGDYLASFFLLLGLGLILIHINLARKLAPVAPGIFFGSAAAGLLLHFLITGWIELTATSSWLTLQRWERLPLFAVTAFLFLYGLELLAGPASTLRGRYPFWMLLIVITWLALAFGVLFLKSGEILLVLLSPYFAVFFLLSGLGIHLARRLTGSATAAAVFGAILLAGFCLVLFPVT
ncbi:MAG TPA: alpha/beta fold hydrolase [Dongiaceae bacterium]|nr:alpha/beta fold hydrolase [Dongiaceae bacterium]